MDYLVLTNSKYSNYFVHTISKRSYNFGVCNYEVMSKHPQKYDHVKKKIKAIVYDSMAIAVDGAKVAAGMMPLDETGSQSRYTVLQCIFPRLVDVYLNITHHAQQFERWMQMWRTSPLEVPCLFFYCENDPMSNYLTVQQLINEYKKRGSFPVIEKGWRESRHASHLMKHTDEYLDYINRLIELVPVLTVHCQKTCGPKL